MHKTIIRQKIDVGNDRTAFTHKIIAVLHSFTAWAETVWRPCFHSLIE